MSSTTANVKLELERSLANFQAKATAQTIANILSSTRPENTPFDTYNLKHLEVFLENALMLNVLNTAQLAVGLYYIDIIFQVLKNNKTNLTARSWIKKYEHDMILSDQDELLCLIGLMFAHKNAFGNDKVFDNTSFLSIYSRGLRSDHVLKITWPSQLSSWGYTDEHLNQINSLYYDTINRVLKSLRRIDEDAEETPQLYKNCIKTVRREALDYLYQQKFRNEHNNDIFIQYFFSRQDKLRIYACWEHHIFLLIENHFSRDHQIINNYAKSVLPGQLDLIRPETPVSATSALTPETAPLFTYPIKSLAETEVAEIQKVQATSEFIQNLPAKKRRELVLTERASFPQIQRNAIAEEEKSQGCFYLYSPVDNNSLKSSPSNTYNKSRS